MVEKELNVCFIIGPARSGTTMLGEQILSKHSNVDYWGEPVFLWRRGNAYNPNDVLKGEDLKKWKRNYLRAKFKKRLNNSGKKILIEKTPSNCFRVEYIREAFPEAKFIHVIRDGRSVAKSALKEWTGEKSQALDSKSFREQKNLLKIFTIVKRKAKFGERFDSPRAFLELPYYILRYINYVNRILFKKKSIWGPNFPGLLNFYKNHTLLETCAYQWEQSHIAAQESLKDLSDDQLFRLKYEDLILNPNEKISSLLNFLNLENSIEQVEQLSKVISSRESIKKQNKPEEFEHIIASTLKELDYR